MTNHRDRGRILHPTEIIEFDTVIDTFPKMLEQIIDNDCWKRRLLRSYNTICEFDYFGEFITAELPRGLNTTVDNIRIALTRFPVVWDKVERLLERRPGNPTGRNQYSEEGTFDNIQDSSTKAPTGTSKAATMRRLRKDAPELAEKVIEGELTANAAAILAGFRKKTVTVTVDVDAIAEKLRRTLNQDQIHQLIELLQRDYDNTTVLSGTRPYLITSKESALLKTYLFKLHGLNRYFQMFMIYE